MKSLALLVIIVTGCCSWAQDYPRLELAAGYSYGSVDTQGYGTQRDAQGWSGSLTANLKRWVGVETEVSSRFQTFSFDYQGNSLALDSRYYTFLAGPRFAHRRGKMTPFVHGLFGLNRSLSYGTTVFDPVTGTSMTPYVNGMAAAAGGGFDYAISRRLAFRSQADYFFTRQAGPYTPTPNNFRVMAAIVFTFGQTESVYARKNSEASVVAKTSAPVQATPVEQVGATTTTLRASDSSPEKEQITGPAPIGAPAPTAPEMPINTASARSIELIAKVEPIASKPDVIVAQPTAPAPALTRTPTDASSPLLKSPHSVIVSQEVDQSQPTAKVEESLGDIARRYREQKRHNMQNQGSGS
jgi:hypothetical protein